MAKTSAISLRVADEIKKAVEKAAAADDRSVASYVERLIVSHLKENGFLGSDTD
jgi:hypothetical protein